MSWAGGRGRRGLWWTGWAAGAVTWVCPWVPQGGGVFCWKGKHRVIVNFKCQVGGSGPLLRSAPARKRLEAGLGLQRCLTEASGPECQVSLTAMVRNGAWTRRLWGPRPADLGCQSGTQQRAGPRCRSRGGGGRWRKSVGSRRPRSGRAVSGRARQCDSEVDLAQTMSGKGQEHCEKWRAGGLPVGHRARPFSQGGRPTALCAGAERRATGAPRAACGGWTVRLDER